MTLDRIPVNGSFVVWAAFVGALVLAAMLAPQRAHADQPDNLAAEIEAWQAHSDGGNAPAIRPETMIQPSGVPALRLVYADSTPHWGNIARGISLSPSTRAFHLRFYKHSSSKEAAMHLWLMEPDGDAWMQPVVLDGKAFGVLDSGWHEGDLPVGMFRYEARGNGKKAMASSVKMLLGCNYGDLDVSFSEVRPVLAGETPGQSPATLPPPAPVRGEKGSVAILAENFVIRRPDTEGPYGVARPLTEEEKKGSVSASDPEWLADLAERAGYGTTLLSASALSSPGYLSPSNFDVLVVPSAPYYPLDSSKAIQSFLAAGGSLLTTGGYAFDSPCTRAGDAWQTVSQALTVAEVDSGAQTMPLNTRFGKAGDTMGLSGDQIGLFDPLTPLKGAQYAESLVSYIPRVRMDGPFEGWAACALLGSNDPVFPKAHARRVPLLMSYDGIGRETGALGAIVHNHAGAFKGSSWAAFGVTNRDLFSRTGELALEVGEILDQVTRRVYLHSLKPEFFLYRPGEQVSLSVACANYGKEAVTAWVQFDILTEEGLPVATLAPVEEEIAPGFQSTFQAQWPVPSAAGEDFYVVRCKLMVDGSEDEMQTAFCVEDRNAMASGVPLKLEENYLEGTDGPRFLLGANQTGAVFCSAFEDPLVWKRDLEKMRDSGLSVMRVLHFSPFVKSATGEERPTPLDLNVEQLPKWLERKLDALVQMTARSKISLMLTLHDWMGVALTQEELHAQKAFTRLIATRYKDCPHVMFDVQNEPNVELSRPETDQKLWNEYLAQKYVNDEALKAAWGDYLGVERLGSVRLERGAEEWANPRIQDYNLFRVWLFNRWMKANVDGVREGSKALVTVGFLQTMTAADQLMGVAWQDFANKHYYGAKEQFARQIKVVDRRFDGKSLSVGEFGSLVDHDARVQGRTREVSDWGWYVEAAGTALGLGGSFILNWCWKDMPDVVFPWGVNTSGDLVSRETLLAFRAFALATGGFRPRYSPPAAYAVAPDHNRMGALGDDVNNALYRAIDALLASRVEFGVINETALERLPGSAKALFLPTPWILADEAYAALKSFVEKGGTLYASGDVTFDTSRRRTHPERLKELFGLEFAGEKAPACTVPAGADGKAGQAIDVKAAGAVAVEGTTLWTHGAGQGRAVFNPVPVELKGSPVSEYAAVLKMAGIAPFAVTSADAGLVVLRAAGAGEGDEAYFLVNRTKEPQQAALPGGVEFSVAPGESALAVYEGGKPSALIASGEVTVDGKEWAKLSAPTALASLDGKPLGESTLLGVHLLGVGEIRISGYPASGAEVWAGEVRQGRWRTLALRQPQQTTGLLIVPAEKALSFAILLVGPRDTLDAGAVEAVRRLTHAQAEPPVD